MVPGLAEAKSKEAECFGDPRRRETAIARSISMTRQLMQAMVREIKGLTTRPFGVDSVHENTVFGPSTIDAHIDICISEGVKLAVFFWNLPPPDWIARLHKAGVRVWYQCASVEKAKQAVDAGIDAIIAQGSEAGGHNKSQSGLFALLPVMVEALAHVPVIAAGGIVDGRGAAAALALGAAGVCVGTRLLASEEAHMHPEYRRRAVAAQSSDITRTCIFGPEWPDQPMLVIRNRVVSEWAAGRDQRTPPQPTPAVTIGATSLFGQP